MSQSMHDEAQLQAAIENLIIGAEVTTFTGIVLQYDHPAPDGTAAVPRVVMTWHNAPTRRTVLMMLMEGLSMLLEQAQDRGSENMPWEATLATAAAQVQAARAAAASQAHAANPRPRVVLRPVERSHTDRARSLRHVLRRTSSPGEYSGRVPGDVYENRPAEGGGNQPPGDGSNQPSEGGGNQPSEGGSNQPSEGGGNQPSEGGSNQPSEGGSNQPSEGGSNQPSEGGGNQPPGNVDEQPSEGGGNEPSEGGGNQPSEGGGD
ncbi:hypothetical protein SLS58_007930 [Diplodia intermedia]|uniref:Uncharacterized protein n=1 Tax=Diplodia intermedia TaxID=856260 RepID=A0ABR3TJ27_9PEZI